MGTRMKVVDSAIDWSLGYSNSPRLKVIFDTVPAPQELEYEQKGPLYFAEKDGLVSFFSYVAPDQGFGGRKFVIKMKDGSTKTLEGPWSSGSYAMNASGFTPCIEVAYQALNDEYGSRWIPLYKWNATFYSGAITVEKAKEVLDHWNTQGHSETPLVLGQVGAMYYVHFKDHQVKGGVLTSDIALSDLSPTQARIVYGVLGNNQKLRDWCPRDFDPIKYMESLGHNMSDRWYDRIRAELAST